MKNSLRRCTRTQFWSRAIVIGLINSILSVILNSTEENSSVILISIISLLLFIYIIIWGVKRMHDVNKSGWYLLIPIYSLVILAFTQGTKGPNDYGVDSQKRMHDVNKSASIL